MKRLCFLLCVLFLFTAFTIEADNLGIKKSSETIVFFLNEALDSADVPVKPDSVHVFTYADNASAATLTSRSTNYPFAAAGIDTLKCYGDTTYVFVAPIADIDGAGGNFQLAIEVKLFGDGLPTSTHATVQVIADSLNTYLTKLDAAVSSRSTLVPADNIGINWGDITNPSAGQALGGTGISSAQSVVGSVGSVTGNVGGDIVGAVNLDNATGTLANSQIDDDVDVNTKTVTAGAISAAAIADDAVDEFWDEDTTGHGTAQSFAAMLKDTTAYQGAASGLTKEEIADEVWLKLTDGANEETFWADLTWVLAKIDTLAMRQGLEAGSWFSIRRWSDKDSMRVGHGTDTLLVQELIHTGAGSGAPPDSGNTIAP